MVSTNWCLLNLSLILGYLAKINSYNVDTKFAILFSGHPKDYFGFSVSLHQNREGYMALVTAPRANSSVLNDKVFQPGVLFSCKLSDLTRQECDEVVLDQYGNVRTAGGKDFSYKDKKDNMWLGVSLDVQQGSTDRNVVVCGHLWKNQLYSDYLVNGVCYVINSDLETKSVRKLIPLVNKSKQSLVPPGIYYYAFGQAGMSAAYSEDGRHLLLGAPGFLDWNGTFITYNLDPSGWSLSSYHNPIIPTVTDRDDASTESYIGYSITSGKFYEDGEIYSAVGAPRDGNSHGMVYLFKPLNETLKTSAKVFAYQRKEGTQFGEYFGASVLGINLNNDQFTDLLVGAPFHSTTSGGDEGKVYVYVSNGMGLQFLGELLGESKQNARFGTCIGNVGDLNQDEFNDVAIGAPYEDVTGTVYIYHGTAKGLNFQYTQRISGMDLSSSLRGFGISISRGLDFDSNYYPDMLIGSYASSHAVVLRSRPIIQVFSKLEFTPPQINTNITNCEFEGEKLPCVNVSSCLMFLGKHVSKPQEFFIKLVLDFGRPNSIPVARGFFLDHNKPVSSLLLREYLTIGTTFCLKETVFIRGDVKDVITPIQFLLNSSLVHQVDSETTFCKDCPIIDTNSASNVTKPLSFQTGCGKDNKCSSDLVVEAHVVGNPSGLALIIGKNSTLTLDITINNYGEPAYLSELFVKLPPEIPVIKQDFCSILSGQQKVDINATLLCELGNPLLKGKIINIQIKIDISKIPINQREIDILLEAKTASTDIRPKNNLVELSIHFKALADISINGNPVHEQTPYIDDSIKFVYLSHIYYIMNHGPSPVQLINIELNVPIAFRSSNGLKKFLSFTGLETDSGKQLTIPANCDDSNLEIISIQTADVKTNDNVFNVNDLKDEGDQITTTVPSLEMKSTTAVPTYAVSRSRRSLSDGSVTQKRKRNDISLNCQTSNCMRIHCSASPFPDNRNFARIVISAQIDVSVLNDVLEPWDRIDFVTSGKVSLSTDMEEMQQKNIYSDEVKVKTIIVRPGPPPSEEVAQWIIFVSIGIGILLLLIIMAALIKIGFFKRRQKEKMRQMMVKADFKEQDPYLINEEAENSDEDSSAFGNKNENNNA